jgi:hypothetical protein
MLVTPLITGWAVAQLADKDVWALGGEDILPSAPGVFAFAVARPDVRHAAMLAMWMGHSGLIVPQGVARTWNTVAISVAPLVWYVFNTLVLTRRKSGARFDIRGRIVAITPVPWIMIKPVDVVRRIEGDMVGFGEPNALAHR